MGARIKPLTGLDALFLYLESAGTPMHVASVIRVIPPKRARNFAETLRQHLIARLEPLPVVRRVLEEPPMALGHPVWRQCEAVDLTQHIRIRRLPRAGSDKQLASLIGRLHAQTLPRERPLWEIIIIDGLADGSVALYMKSHHALVDGQAGVQLTQAILDIEPKPAQTPSEASAAGKAKPSKPNDLAKAALRAAADQFGRILRGVPDSWRQLQSGLGEGSVWKRLRDSVWLAPRTPFNVTIGDKRRWAFTSLSLSQVKRVAKSFEASLNDVVMALVADALRGYLVRRRLLPEDSLIAAMPVSLRGEGQEGGNEVSMVQCPLATDEADPVERLRAIVAATREIKGRVNAFRGLIPTDFPGVAAPIWVSGLSQLWKRGKLSERLPALANLVVSNVPGPRVPLYVAGGLISHFHPVSIVTHGLGLNITLLSYQDSLEFGIVTAPESMNKPELICDALHAALARLMQECET